MNRLLKKGSAIVGLLMMAIFAFTGCAALVDAARLDFALGGDRSFTLYGWQAIGVGTGILFVLAIIAFIVYVKVVRNKK